MENDMPNPTTETYVGLQAAYGFFNARLFDGVLPACLLTLQRKGRAAGYFAGGRFVSAQTADACDEIALNPALFRNHGTREVLSTLVHEMAHLWQHHYGTPGRRGYHNREWANQMLQLGLMPSHTGAPGGRQTGHRMTHYIADGGAFDVACAAFMRAGYTLPYVEVADLPASPAKAASKTRYTCGGCGQNAWAKPGAGLMCSPCALPMQAQGRRSPAATPTSAVAN
jgi:hypothetical protein